MVDGIDNQSCQRSHDRAIEADELQVFSYQKLNVFGGFRGVPALDGLWDDADDVAGEVLGGPARGLVHDVIGLLQNFGSVCTRVPKRWASVAIFVRKKDSGSAACLATPLLKASHAAPGMA